LKSSKTKGFLAIKVFHGNVIVSTRDGYVVLFDKASVGKDSNVLLLPHSQDPIPLLFVFPYSSFPSLCTTDSSSSLEEAQTQPFFIITGSLDKTARIWNSKGDLIRNLATTGGVSSMCIREEGNGEDEESKQGVIFTGSSNGTVTMWSLKGGSIAVHKYYNDQINSMKIRANLLFSGSADHRVTISSFRYALLLFQQT
jgi:WD40 repeat protein